MWRDHLQPLLETKEAILSALLFASWEHLAYGKWLRKVPSLGRWAVDLVRWFAPLPGRFQRREKLIRPLVQLMDSIPANDSQILLIAHSMGTVLAYHYLQYEVHYHRNIWLLTIGSPLAWVPNIFLGMSKVIPSDVVRWANFFHHADPVAGTKALSWLLHDHTLGDEYLPSGMAHSKPERQVVDWPIYHSEASPHDSNGYLHSRSVQVLVHAFAHDEGWPFDPIRRRLRSGT